MAKRTASVDKVLYRNSVVWFGAFFLFMVWAFWPSYFSHILDQPEVRFHTHGIALTLWCALLIVQGFLIRTGRKAIHRSVGRTSYVLVPLIVAATVNLVHFRMQGANPPTNVNFYFLALVLNALVVFVVFYGLAIYYRREPAIHARYMICTAFPLFTPITDRLIVAHFQSLVPLVPVIDRTPIVPVLGFVLADVILIGLTIWDRRTNRRADVFPVALAVLVVYHASVLTFYRIPLWKSFGEWFLKLPLS